MPEPNNVTTLLKSVAGGLSSIAGLFLLFNKLSNRMATGLRKDVETLTERVNKIEEQTQKLRERIVVIDKDIKRVAKIEKLDTRVAVLEAEQERNVSDILRISSPTPSPDPRIPSILSELGTQKEEIHKVRTRLDLQQVYLEEMTRKNCLPRRKVT